MQPKIAKAPSLLFSFPRFSSLKVTGHLWRRIIENIRSCWTMFHAIKPPPSFFLSCAVVGKIGSDSTFHTNIHPCCIFSLQYCKWPGFERKNLIYIWSIYFSEFDPDFWVSNDFCMQDAAHQKNSFLAAACDAALDCAQKTKQKKGSGIQLFPSWFFSRQRTKLFWDILR